MIVFGSNYKIFKRCFIICTIYYYWIICLFRLCCTGWSFSGWAGALALAIILLPVVVRTTDDMLKLVPNSLREAAFALGAPQWKVITLVSYKAAKLEL